jgi:hypothetical protein
MPFDTNCFINCPFDQPYEKKLLKPIAFTVIAMGLHPQICENPSNGPSRLDFITQLIMDSKYGIHDISRMKISKSGFPRFNMPFELGLDMGIRSSGETRYRSKVIYILDERHHRHAIALSDLAGYDPIIHKANPETLIRGLRNAFYITLNNPNISSSTKLWFDYQKSRSDILLHLDISEDEFNLMQLSEYTHWVKQWISGAVPHVTV